MQHHDDRTAFCHPTQHVIHQVCFRVLIHSGKGFVEDDDLCVLHHRSREQRALELPGRELMQRQGGDVVQADARNGLTRPQSRARTCGVKEPQLAPPACFHQIANAHGETAVKVGKLTQVANGLRRRATGPGQGARLRAFNPEDGFHQRGFARAIMADDREDFPRLHIKRQRTRHGFGTVADGKVFRL